jgi:hypothetical protein
VEDRTQKIDNQRLVKRLPGFHLKVVQKLSPQRGIPVLAGKATVVQGSSATIT